MYSLYLTNHGFRVVEAANGEDAVRLAHEQQPALVLIDLGMPVMDGREATRRIKADPRTRSVPVLAVSGHALADSVNQAKDAGVDPSLENPASRPLCWRRFTRCSAFQTPLVIKPETRPAPCDCEVVA